MADLTLFHATPSRSSIVHWMLEELGEPYEIHLVSFKKGENRTPEYLAINPMGKVPTLKHGDTIITEVAAICTYLADEFPGQNLSVPALIRYVEYSECPALRPNDRRNRPFEQTLSSQPRRRGIHAKCGIPHHPRQSF